MKQMVAPQAPVVEQIPFWRMTDGFFRRTIGGEIFFGENYAGRMCHFPVLEDGSISKHGHQFISDEETVNVIDLSALGIKELKWTEERPSA